jgi:SAM-dependent methyltransferase
VVDSIAASGVRVSQTTMLEFYQQHGVSPVKQDISDLQAHFARRAHLYRSLGLWPESIRGKYVLEVGAGSGHNALYTASLKPAGYVAIEPNPAGAADIKALVGEDISVVRASIEDFAPASAWDVVLCEGLLGLSGGNKAELLETLIPHVKVGGVLVITCIDAISDHSEVLRRALAQRYIKNGASLQENVEILKPIFAPHLATLKGMTRSVEDWIIDNILNPASIEVLGCSPRFLIDWRWYKEAESGNQWAIQSYWRNCHNLIDYRMVQPERSAAENQLLMAYCTRTREDVAAYERGDINREQQAWLHDADGAWFGRGQQYLSVVRVN